MNLYLKIAAIINFIVGGFFVLLGLPEDIPFLLGYGLFELGIGVVYYTSSKEDVVSLYSKRMMLLILAILNLLPNIFSSIFVFISYDNIKIAYRKSKHKKSKKDKITKEKRNLDTLLKVGVGLILLSGIIFMNSEMFMASPWAKFCFLVFLSLLFYALYLFSNRYLKIKNTTWGYHLLSMFFIILSFASIQNLGLFDSWFSEGHGGEDLFYSAFFLMISGISYLSSKKFDYKLYLYILYAGLFFGLHSFLDFVQVPEFMELVCMNLIILLVSLLDFIDQRKKTIFMNTLLIETYVLSCVYISTEVMTDSVMCLFSAFLLIGNMYVLTIPNKNTWAPILTTLFSIPVLPYMTYLLNLPTSVEVWVLTLSYCLLFGILLLNKYTRKNKLFYTLTTIVLNLSLFGVYAYSYLTDMSMALMVSFALLFVHFMYLTVFDSDKTIEYYLQPVKTGILIYTCGMLLKPSFLLDQTLILNIVSMLLLLMVHLRLEKDLKWDYFITYLISNVITFMTALYTGNMMGSLFVIALSIYASYFTYHHQEKRVYKLYPLTYGWTLLMIYELVSVHNVFLFPQILSDILVILSFTIGVVINSEDKKMFIGTLIALLLPIYHLFTNIVDVKVIEDIFINFVLLGVTLWFSEKNFKRDKDKNIFATLMVGILFVTIMFQSNWLIGIYVGIVTLGLMFYTMNNKKYPSLYNLSLIIFILNLLIHIQDLWKSIPFWAYLLFAGIVTIGVVTYKEMKKEKRK